ncbi:hypothetical protein TNCV_607791 [Trichonephila clavipes]|nr:hypothetical protein TNCV_607791 [Trichonephila clavipes]
MRGLATRRLFRVPPCCEGTIHLQTSMSSPGFEPRPYGTVVGVVSRYTGWATGSFAMQEKGGNRLDVLKLPNQAPRVSGKSLQACVTWRCLDGIQHFICWPILTDYGQSLASNGLVVESRDLNLVFGCTEATHNKLFLSSPTKYTVEPSWPLVLVWPLIELLHHSLTTIVFAQYCPMGPISHLICLSNGLISFCLARALKMEIRSIMFLGVNWCGTQNKASFLIQLCTNGLKLFYG